MTHPEPHDKPAAPMTLPSFAPLPKPYAAPPSYLEAERALALDGPSALPQRAAITGGTPAALGFAIALASAGTKVHLIEADKFDAERSRDLLERTGKSARIAVTTKMNKAAKADVVIDASDLHQDALQAHLAQTETHAKTDALLIVLGARPDIARLGLSLDFPQRLVAITPVAPPPMMSFVEINTGPRTDPESLEHAKALVRALNACPLDAPRRITERLVARLEDTAEALIYDGTTPDDYDAALSQFGMDPPPCAAWDNRGLDLTYRRHRLEEDTGTRSFPLPVLDRMVPEGRLGRKGGVGWFRYPGGGGQVTDPLVEDLVREEAHFHAHAQPGHDGDTLRRLTLLALIDAAAELLRDGARAAHIDLVSIHALGFPSHHGGLAHFATRYGLARARDELNHLVCLYGPRWAPGPALASAI